MTSGDATEPNGKSRTAARFRAFLSYSHADRAAARRLHRRLETYRLPARLDMPAFEGAPPHRLGPIFRDREDLSAAADLSESVKQALAASDALIVLCSPDARASPWVAREITLFRELHPGRPILAALIKGNPAEVFPPALTEAGEPLAADLRREGDGERLGFLKIVAGLAGVPLDALVQRDAQRRIRQVTGISIGALVAVIVMAGLAVLALDARDEARDQRAEAEGQIEYMLTDLRDDLRRAGRLDVMTQVNQRALAYYASQGDLTALPPESLERRARVLHAMGEDDATRGELDRAQAQFAEALRTTSELLAREPDNPDRIFTHAQSEYWVGLIAYREAARLIEIAPGGEQPVLVDDRAREHLATARRHWSAYKALADRLIATDPGDVRWLRESGYAEGNLCTLEIAWPTNSAAMLRHCRVSLARMQRVAELMPGAVQARQDVANRWAWLSTALRANGDAGGAQRARRTQERLLDRLLAVRPNDVSVQDQWMRAQMTGAELLDEMGRPREAAEYRSRARAVARRLIALDPENEQWQTWAQRIDRAELSVGVEGER